MHDEKRDALQEAFYRAAEYGAARPRTFDVPESAQVRFGTGPRLYAGMTVSWCED